jgi:hypothetical protein
MIQNQKDSRSIKIILTKSVLGLKKKRLNLRKDGITHHYTEAKF